MSTQVKPRMLIFLDKEPTVVIWHPRVEVPTNNVLFIYKNTPHNVRIPPSFGYLKNYSDGDTANRTLRSALKEIHPTMSDSALYDLYESLRPKFAGRHSDPYDLYYSPDDFIDGKGVFEVPLERQPEILTAILEGNDHLITPHRTIYNGDLL